MKDIGFYEVYKETVRIRRALGFGTTNDAYKVMKHLAEYWPRHLRNEVPVRRVTPVTPQTNNGGRHG